MSLLLHAKACYLRSADELAHAQHLLMLPALVEEIDGGQYEHRGHRPKRHVEQHAADQSERRGDVHVRRHHELRIAVLDGIERD